MRFMITPFVRSNKMSLELEDFEPTDGYEAFLREFCVDSESEFIDWFQGVESGCGHIRYRENVLNVYWSDFPFALSFDCASLDEVKELKQSINLFMKRAKS